MARRRRLRKKRSRDYDYEDLPSFELSDQTKRTVMIVTFLVLAVLSFLALFDLAGRLGRIVVQILGLLFGWAAIAVPVIFFGLV